MPDPKKSSSIFSFSDSQLIVIKVCTVFFLPVILLFGAVEYMVRQVPTNYKIIGEYMEKESANIEVASFGSSQMKGAINPALIDKPSINLGSSSQHHNTDFKILRQTRERFKNLKTVAFEVSYGHFEIPHNSKYFWKGNVFLEYYGVNIFERPAWLKDHILFSSNPGFYSDLMMRYYIKNNLQTQYNEYGFDENYFTGKFKKLNYDTIAIAKSKIDIDRRSNQVVFRHNIEYFYDMLDYCKSEGLNVIICSPPTYSNFNRIRKQDVLRRRDSMLRVIGEKYENVTFLQTEQDGDFKATHFRNENHLNSNGAKVFSSKLNTILNNLN